MPSTCAASCSSRDRTAARLWPSSSARSLTDPFSPCDAQMSTTRAPASARRASVPPQAMDTSSGCADPARIVRPEKSGALGGDDALINGFVLVDHAIDPEALHGTLADSPAVERKRLRQLLDHLAKITENQPRHAVVDHFADGSEVQRDDRRSAGHGFRQHETERLTRLDRVHERARAAEEPHLGVEIRLAVIHDL